MATAETIALRNVSKFNGLANVVFQTENQKYRTNVLFGEDGQYWVPANHREESILVRLGYERVSKDTLSLV